MTTDAKKQERLEAQRARARDKLALPRHGEMERRSDPLVRGRS